jgi:hypothetical protein
MAKMTKESTTGAKRKKTAMPLAPKAASQLEHFLYAGGK